MTFPRSHLFGICCAALVCGLVAWQAYGDEGVSSLEPVTGGAVVNRAMRPLGDRGVLGYIDDEVANRVRLGGEAGSAAEAVQEFVRYVEQTEPKLRSPLFRPSGRFYLARSTIPSSDGGAPTYAPVMTEYVVVLIHGLSDSPWFLQTLRDLLFQKGMNVFSLLLASHGSSRLADFALADREAWRRDVEWGTRLASQLGRHVILAGFSNGGGLALDAAFRHPEQYHGLLLFSPAVQSAGLPVFSSISMGAMGCARSDKAEAKSRRELAHGGTSEPSPPPFAMNPEVWNPWLAARYPGIALKATCESYLLGKEMTAAFETVRDHVAVRSFWALTEADRAVDVPAALELYRRMPEPKALVLHPRRLHVAHAMVTRPYLEPGRHILLGSTRHQKQAYEKMIGGLERFLEGDFLSGTSYRHPELRVGDWSRTFSVGTGRCVYERTGRLLSTPAAVLEKLTDEPVEAWSRKEGGQARLAEDDVGGLLEALWRGRHWKKAGWEKRAATDPERQLLEQRLNEIDSCPAFAPP